jgi:DnaJ-class molecular chaperone
MAEKRRKPVDCAMCMGSGKVLVASKNGSTKQEERPCSRCNGTGKTTS